MACSSAIEWCATCAPPHKDRPRLWLELNDSAARCLALCTSGVNSESFFLTRCATQSVRNSPHAAVGALSDVGFRPGAPSGNQLVIVIALSPTRTAAFATPRSTKTNRRLRLQPALLLHERVSSTVSLPQPRSGFDPPHRTPFRYDHVLHRFKITLRIPLRKVISVPFSILFYSDNLSELQRHHGRAPDAAGRLYAWTLARVAKDPIAN